jgi:hypothetical protein
MMDDDWLAPLIAKYEESRAARIDYEDRLIPITDGRFSDRPDLILTTPETLAEFDRLRDEHEKALRELLEAAAAPR